MKSKQCILLRIKESRESPAQEPEVESEVSLQGRRTANAQVSNVELGLRVDFFISQQTDRGKYRSDWTGT